MSIDVQNLDHTLIIRGMKHLWDQGRCAFDNQSGDGECRYRIVTEDGTVLKCIAGAFINDDLYSIDFEGLPATDRYVTKAIRESIGSEPDGLTLQYLQRFHDGIVEDGWDHEGNFKAPSPKEVRNAIVQEVIGHFQSYSPEEMLKEISGGTYHEYK